MNVWILNHYATPPDTPGGTRHYDFARELIKSGHQVTIFASGFSHRTRKEERLEKRQKYHSENINGVEFFWLRTSPYYGGNDWRRVVNMLSYAFRVVHLGLRLTERPDIILASSPHPFAGLAGWLLAKFKKATFIFEVRDLWPQTFLEIGGYSDRSLTVKLLRMLEKFLYQRAERIIVLLPKASDYITGLGIPANKIVYIPNGISPDLFSKASTELMKELRNAVSDLKSQEKTLVVYAGAHGIADALDTILETARLLQRQDVGKIHFFLVGAGPEKQRLTEAAQSWHLSNISFFSPIPKTQIPHLLDSADILVLTKRNTELYKYGISFIKIFDYMMSAKPIIWAVNSVNNPVAEAKCGITVPPEDAKAMAKAVLKLCDFSEEERQEMGMRGYEYVMKNHSVPILAKKLLKVLRDTRPD